MYLFDLVEVDGFIIVSSVKHGALSRVPLKYVKKRTSTPLQSKL